MIYNLKTFLFLMVLVFCFPYKQNAQTGSSCSSKMAINSNFRISTGTNISINSPLEVNTYSSISIDSGSNVSVLGSLDVNTNGNIDVNSGAVLNTYGNILNKSIINIFGSGRINFYGNQIENSASGVVNGNGHVFITSPRPSIDNQTLISNSCLSSFNGGLFMQNIYSNNENSFLNTKIHLTNAKGISLHDSIKINGTIYFDSDGSNLFLADNNLSLNSNAALESYSQNKFIVTNGTGKLILRGLAPSSQFEFPIGIDSLDYTPAIIKNNNSLTDTFFVNVKSYLNSLSDESNGISEGIDRTWNIHSNLKSAITLYLQHNNSTNGSNFADDSTAFVTQYYGNSVWQTGIGGTNTKTNGSISGSVIHSRTYSSTSNSSDSAQSFYSVSSNILVPLPNHFLDFKLVKLDKNKVKISWSCLESNGLLGFEVEKLNSINLWKSISPNIIFNQLENQYSYIDSFVQHGNNFYRIKTYSEEHGMHNSEFKSLFFNFLDDNQLVVFPNPSEKFLKISSSNPLEQIFIFDNQRQIVYEGYTDESEILIEIGALKTGIYVLQVNNLNYLISKN